MRSNMHRRLCAIILVTVLGLFNTGCEDAAKDGFSIGIRQGVGAVANTLVLGITDILANSIAQLGGATEE